MYGKLKYGRDEILSLVYADAHKRLATDKPNIKTSLTLQIEFWDKIKDKAISPADVVLYIHAENVDINLKDREGAV